jgi:hypothetical protein
LALEFGRDVDSNGLQNSASDIADVIRHFPSLRTLRLSLIDFNPGSMQSLAPALPASLERLDLSSNRLDLGDNHPLLDALSRMHSLTSLILNSNTIKDKFVDGLIAEVIPNTRCLSTLELGGNSSLSNESIQKLVPHLKKLPSLTRLTVDQTMLNPEGAMALSGLMQANPGLRVTKGWAPPLDYVPINLHP